MTVPPVGAYAGYLSAWFAPLRMRLIIVATLALVGTLLAALGIYALVAYHVSSTRRELGIRVALGAPGNRLFAGVLRQAVVMAGGGLIVGFAAWYAALPSVREHLSPASDGGWIMPAAVTLFVGVITLAAALAPASRTRAVDPVVTLSESSWDWQRPRL